MICKKVVSKGYLRKGNNNSLRSGPSYSLTLDPMVAIKEMLSTVIVLITKHAECRMTFK